MILCNGAEGIGTGWSTSVPNYDPRELIANMRLCIRKKKPKPMKPWYRGFTGTIKPSGERGKYDCLGAYTESSKTIYQITELPIRKWTQDYKEFLQACMPGSEKRTKLNVYDIREYHTENKVHFVVRLDGDKLKAAAKDEGGVEGAFRLKNTISETNIVLFDHEGKIKRYKNVVEVMSEFGKVRLKFYDIRKKYLIDKLTLERDLLANRARFIGMIIAKKLHINNRKKADVVKDLTRLKFKKFGDTTPPRTGYEYLLIMQILSLTLERKLELEKMLKLKSDELSKIKKTTIQQMWSADLDHLEQAINELYGSEGADDDEGKGKKGKSDGSKGDVDDIDAVALIKRPAAAKAMLRKSGRKWLKKRPAAFEEDDEDEEQQDEEKKGSGEGEESGTIDSTGTGNIFGDTQRWIGGLVKAPGGLRGGKRRRF